MSTSSIERRQHPRVPYGAWVEDEANEQGLRFYLAENLSIGGLLLKTTAEPPPLGSRVRIRLVIENESRVMSVQGEVVRSESEGRFAVRFIELDAVRQAFLKDLIKELQ